MAGENGLKNGPIENGPIQCFLTQLCGCVSFLVVAGNSSQNENMFLQKNLIGLLYYDPLAGVCSIS